MRVALLQVAFDRASRSSGMQRMLEAVDCAGASQPPAELLILPGACDRDWPPGELGRVGPLSYVVRETIAWKAREWGLFIANGFGGYPGDERFAKSCLFDPDGDRVACATVGAREGVSGESPKAASWATAVGGIVLVACDSSMATVPSLPGNLQGMLVVLYLPHNMAHRGPRERVVAFTKDLAENEHARQGNYWAVVKMGVDESQSSESPVYSEVYDPCGTVIAAADTQGQSAVFADLPL